MPATRMRRDSVVGKRKKYSAEFKAKVAVRKAENLAEGKTVNVQVVVNELKK